MNRLGALAVAVAVAMDPVVPAAASEASASPDATVPLAASAIAIDGATADWDDIPALPAPYSHKSAGALRLAWREDGLYGCVRVVDRSIDTDESSPWKGDTVELWLDPTGARATEMGDAIQLQISPKTLDGPGPCSVMVAQGQLDANALVSAWTTTADGYVIEFHIPSTELAPAVLRAGTRLGFSYAIDDDGKPIEQFHNDKDAHEAYRHPSEWGLVELR